LRPWSQNSSIAQVRGFHMSQSEKRDIVLFLGAGFSCDAGLPTMASFGKESNRELAELYKIKCNRAVPLLYEAGRVFKAFQESCRTPNGSIGLDTENMETMFCIAEAMNEAQVNPFMKESPGQGFVYPADELLKQIQFWLWGIYKACPPLNDKRQAETQPAAYEEFASLLNEASLQRRTTVLTTNYDLLLEYYTWALNGCFCYPLNENMDYVALQAGPATWPSYLNSPAGYLAHPQDSLIVCKLHGSINFFDLTSTGQSHLGICDDIAVMTQYVGDSGIPLYEPKHNSIISQGNRERRPAIFALGAIWSLRERYGSSIVPAIIPPTYAKLQRQPWLRRMWNRAFRAIQDARVLVFIGYSLPASDGFMRAMIQGALASRTDDGPQVYVVNPFKVVNEEAAYKELFPSLKEECVIKDTFARAWGGRLREILENAARQP
jgi:hypothetical protein